MMIFKKVPERLTGEEVSFGDSVETFCSNDDWVKEYDGLNTAMVENVTNNKEKKRR